MNEERLRVLAEGYSGGGRTSAVHTQHGPVVYWMSRDQRAADNWALLYAQETALRRKTALAVVFCLVPDYPGATIRHYHFMLEGLREVAHALDAKQIPFFLVSGNPGIEIPRFVKRCAVGELVTDFDPLKVKRAWKGAVVSGKTGARIVEVDAHNIVPCWTVSPKQEFGAYTIRPKLKGSLPGYLRDFPALKGHPYRWKGSAAPIDWTKALSTVRCDRSVPPVGWIRPGERAAALALRTFVRSKLAAYDLARNDPCLDGQSGLSPYLHFGQLSAQRVALAVRTAAPSSSREAFLEELVVRRELADNFCLHNTRYDSMEGFPAWAQKTLAEHRKDRREVTYSLKTFEAGKTRDPLWNAAQLEMVKRGKMHGYMRMYWAKKILEWSASPMAAMKTAIYLNDKYELDGRDPNGYAGIAWSIGGVHDRAWFPRPVYGKIRYMSYNGCRSKFDVDAYIEKVRSL